MFERFSESARQVVLWAQDEARELKHNYIGTEHLLLGLLREEEGVAAQALAELGVTLEAARDQVVRIVGRGDEIVTGQIPFTPRAKRVLELALRQVLALGDQGLGPEHILLGLVSEGEGVATRILADCGADASRVREVLGRLLSRPIGPLPPERPRPFPWQPSPPSKLPGFRFQSAGWVLLMLGIGIGILIGWAIWAH